MTNETVVTFAYGSNMLSDRLIDRVPSAKPIGIGQLRGHVLRWHKRSRDGSGKCDVEKTEVETDTVWGVLFRLRAPEKRALDSAEGLNSGYAEKQVDIISNIGTIRAQVYYATDKDDRLKPYDWYKAFVVTGAREHSLPADYVATLEKAASTQDPDKARAAANEQLLQAARTRLNAAYPKQDSSE